MVLADPNDVNAVVFDVNVYLDVAALVGPPFSWHAFNTAAAQHQKADFPHRDPRVDSLRALAVCTSGRLAGDRLLQVWTSDHIDGLVLTKAEQPAEALIPEDRGLGWTSDQALDLVDQLVHDLVFDHSAGGTVGAVTIPYGTPPLSHEDGCVYRTAVDAGDGHVQRFCVTGDQDFLKNAGHIDDDVTLLSPREWVRFVRRARQEAALLRMRPRPGP